MPDRVNPYETMTVSDVLSDFKVQAEAGLSDKDVKERQIRYGLN